MPFLGDWETPTALAADMVRRGLHDLMPYDDPEHGYIDPLVGSIEARGAVRSFLATLFTAAMEARAAGGDTSNPPTTFVDALQASLDEKNRAKVRELGLDGSVPEPTTCPTCDSEGFVTVPAHHPECWGNCEKHGCPYPDRAPCPDCRPAVAAIRSEDEPF
jgi:hypothetical protein